MTGRLAGKTALVTGAGSGIGRAVAARLALEGARVVVADIDAGAATSVASELLGQGNQALSVQCDVASEPSVDAAVQTAVDWGGTLDVVIANAGIMVQGDLLSLSLEDWQRAMGVNATGAFLTARAAMPHLIGSGSGALVFNVSTVALVGMKGIAAYSASKGAVVALTRQLAADYADMGVRVNAVAPGAVRTALSESQFRVQAEDETDFNDLLDKVIARYPLARWGQPEEIAEVVLFLASDQSSWMTGQILPVDGGLLELR